MNSPEDYLGRVQVIVWDASKYVSAAGIQQVQHLVDHGEPAEGMCTLAWIIVNEQRRVPATLIRDIRSHAEGMVDEEFMPENLDDYGTDEGGPQLRVFAPEDAGGSLPTLEIDAQRMPNIARNIQSALDEGHPGILNRTTNEGVRLFEGRDLALISAGTVPGMGVSTRLRMDRALPGVICAGRRW